MRFLPIVERELRVAARRPATRWVRLGAATVALLIGAWLMILPHFQNAQTLGIALFAGLSIVVFAYCTLAGVRTTADCLSEEKREGTLGLLFLTDLKGYDVILGKLVASSINIFYGILAIFPVMAIPLLMGGVSVQEFWRVVLASLNNLFFSLSAGMLASALCRDERRAMSLCFLILLFFVVALPVTGLIVAESRRLPQPSPLFFIPSPGYAAVMSFDASFNRMGFNYYYWSILCIHLLSWTFLILACCIVPRAWQDKARSVAAEQRLSFWRRITRGGTAERLAMRTRMLNINPFYWLAGRDRLQVATVWIFLASCAALWGWGLAKHPNIWRDEVAYLWSAVIVHSVFKVWLASESTRRLTADRRNGALELLLSTPMSVRQIMTGQILALRRQFLAPLLVVLASDVLFLTARNEKEWIWTWLAGIFMLVADVITLPFVGMWAGLTARNSNRATGMVVGRILVLPWIIWALLWAGLVAVRFRQQAPGAWLESMLYISWVAIGLGVNLFFGLGAFQRLRKQFRTAATERYHARGSRREQPA